jgi:hypothetical protein
MIDREDIKRRLRVCQLPRTDAFSRQYAREVATALIMKMLKDLGHADVVDEWRKVVDKDE